jgi:nicotinate-nucleotide--dimethylbenzimidazole phosphoribosyltransferase
VTESTERCFFGCCGHIAQRAAARHAKPEPRWNCQPALARQNVGNRRRQVIARTAGANLRVTPLALDSPTADFAVQPALSEQDFLAAVAAGYGAVAADSDLVVLMGIGNTTAAAAIALPK